MAIPIPGSSCGCPITKTLTVNFTGSNPAPSNGYIVGYRKSGSYDAYTYVSPNPTSSPVTIPNVAACEDIEVVVQSQCDNSQVSTPQTTIVGATSSYVCGDTITASHTHNGYYKYPDYLLNLQAAAGTVNIAYNAIDKVNRFAVYDEDGNTVAGPVWAGTANYPGQWGTGSINNPSQGTLQFTKAAGKCFYKLVVESQTDVSFNDSFTVTIGCPTGDIVTPTFTLVSCSNGVGSYKAEAPAGTNMKIKLTASGTLTNNSTQYCAQLQGTITSSTGPTDNEQSSIISTTGAASIGDTNSLFVDVTIPGSGYLDISTIVKTVNSAVGNTTAFVSLYEVNGSALETPITLSVCVVSQSTVLSCGTASTQYFFATRYTKTACVQQGTTDQYIVAFNSGVNVTQGKYYVPATGSGEENLYRYLIGASTTTGQAALFMQDLSATTCAGASNLNPPV